VIANLGLYFAVHTLFSEVHEVDAGPVHMTLPDLGAVRPVPLAIAVIAAVLIFWRRWSVLRVLGVSAGLGLIAGLAGLPGV
jgi:chromate transporter